MMTKIFSDLQVVKRPADGTPRQFSDALEEESLEYVPSTGFPKMGQYLRINFGIIDEVGPIQAFLQHFFY